MPWIYRAGCRACVGVAKEGLTGSEPFTLASNEYRNQKGQTRFTLPGVPQYIIQRGNNHDPCFYATEDYTRYLHDLNEALNRNDAKLHAYILMTNHVHLLVTPMTEHAMSHVMQQKLGSDPGFR